MCECKDKLVRRSDGINPHLWWHTGIYAALSVPVLAWIWFGLSWLAENPEAANTAPATVSLVERLIRVGAADEFGFGGVLAMEWITNGNILGQIVQESRACAIVVAAILGFHAYILCWT